VEQSLDGNPFSPVEAKADGDGTRFASTVPLGTVAEGPHVLVLRATDKAGNTAQLPLPFQKDSTTPSLAVIAPRP
jgi:hypothetical protein